MSVIELKNISKSFYSGNGPQVVFENLNLKVNKGELLALLGPSGCGKSTLLRIIANLENVSSGELQRRKEAQSLAYVFQEPRLIPWRNIRKNISLPLDLLHKMNEKGLKSINHWIKKVRLEDSEKKYPFQLSGGMKMRAALARAMVTEPEVLLLDEPLSSLDELTKFDLQVEIRKVVKETKTTAIFVTHSISEACFVADRIVIMSTDGKIVFDAPVDLTANRSSAIRQSQEFFKTLNFFQGQFEQHARGHR